MCEAKLCVSSIAVQCDATGSNVPGSQHLPAMRLAPPQPRPSPDTREVLGRDVLHCKLAGGRGFDAPSLLCEYRYGDIGSSTMT
jgi:hypothetical protein